MKYDPIAVLIPAYKPDERLITLTDALIARGFSTIVAIDDGGGATYAPIFKALAGKAAVLTHEVNRGKGAGLKTGIGAIREMPGITGIVTADCDGQHTPDDIAKIADALLTEPDSLVIGCRDKKQMPPRSKFGNTLTCGLFKLLTGLYVSDTQTGLRGLPACAYDALYQLDGDRYEYETNMLIYAAENGLKVTEVSIETVYIDNNASSHFSGLKDGLRIYKLMFRQAKRSRFLGASIATTLAEYILCMLLKYVLGLSELIAEPIGRVLSAALNYWLNAKFVFEKKPGAKSAVRYFVLAVMIFVLDEAGIWLLSDVLPVPYWLSKPIVSVVLFICSYAVQHNRIFADGEK